MSEKDVAYEDEELHDSQEEGNEDEDLDEGVEGSDDDDDGVEGDPDGLEVSADGDVDERESIRERRRHERKQRKLAAREREDTLRRELAARDAVINELRGKVNGIERRNSSGELARIEQARQQTAQAYAYFKDQIRIATNAGNGAVVADATEKMLQAQQKFNELQNFERVYKQRQAAPQPLDPRLVNHAKNWMSQNKWYNPAGTDQDSRITLTIDQQMADENWDPTTQEYWEELSNRVKKYLPHKAVSAKMNPRRPKSVVTGSRRETSSPQASGYKLSAERVQALKDAGLWDDQKQRAEAVKRFREFDKQNQG
jgi:hypothetical protein